MTDYVPCPACGEQVFVRAYSCAHCGATLRRRVSPIALWGGLAGVAAIAVALIVAWTAGGKPPHAAESPANASQLASATVALGGSVAPAPGSPASAAGERAYSGPEIKVRGRVIRPGMAADEAFGILRGRDVIRQKIEADPDNPPNARLVKSYRIGKRAYLLEFRIPRGENAYRLTAIREEASPNRTAEGKPQTP